MGKNNSKVKHKFSRQKKHTEDVNLSKKQVKEKQAVGSNKQKRTSLVKLSIRKKLLLGFLIPIVCIIILGKISYSKSAKGLTESYEKSTTQAFNAVSNHFCFALKGVETSVLEQINDKQVGKYTTGYFNDDSMKLISVQADIQNTLNAKRISNQFIKNIYIIPRKGSQIISTETMELQGFFDEYRSEEEGSKVCDSIAGVWTGRHDYLDSVLGQDGSEYAISFARKFDTENGCIIIDVKYNEIRNSLQSLSLGDGSIVGFITGDGKEIYPEEDTQIQENLFSSQTFYKKSMESEDTFGHSYETYNNKEYMYLYSKIGDTGFTICALVPKEVILGKAQEIRNTTLILVVFVCIVSMLIGCLLSANIGRSIGQLIKNLKMVAEGDFTTDISVKSKDELSILAGSIQDTLEHVRGLISQVAELSMVVTGSAQEVAATTDVMGSMANNINLSIVQIGEAIEGEAKEAQYCVNDMEMLSNKITNVNDKVVEIEAFANDTNSMIKTDIKTMGKLSNQSDQANDIMESLTTSIGELEDKTKSVNAFIEIINGIATQTNLLSLNASIEAARAGDAGRGFAVVAEEIRKLSEESANAANEIKKVATDIMKQTQSTVSSVGSAQEIVKMQNETVVTIIHAFHGLSEEVERLLNVVSDIGTEMNNMATDRAKTLDSISNISASTEETYSVSITVDGIVKEQEGAVIELRKVSDELKGKAVELEKAIGVFKI